MPVVQTEESDYNFAAWRPECYPRDRTPKLQVGDVVPNSVLFTLDGTPVNFHSLLQDRPLVLECGSMSCPTYRQHSKAMNKLYQNYREKLDFALLYVRECHPSEGGRLPAHSGLRSKRSAALQLATSGFEKRPVIVDNVEGSMHKAMSLTPNFVAVIDCDGTVLFRAAHNYPEKLESEILTRILSGQNIPHCIHFPNTIPVPSNMTIATTLWTSGFDAIKNFFAGSKELVEMQKEYNRVVKEEEAAKKLYKLDTCLCSRSPPPSSSSSKSASSSLESSPRSLPLSSSRSSFQ